MNASGLKSRPSCASSVKIGANEMVMTSSAKNSVGPTSVAARVTIRQWGRRPPSRSRWRCVFSTITIAASTIAPTAIAMPPSDMTLASMPCRRMTTADASTASGSVSTATAAERTCSRKRAQTSATIAISSSSFRRSVSIDRSISAVRS